MTVHDFVSKVISTEGEVELILTNYTDEDIIFASTDRSEFIKLLEKHGYHDADLLTVKVSHNDPTVYIVADVA